MSGMKDEASAALGGLPTKAQPHAEPIHEWLNATSFAPFEGQSSREADPQFLDSASHHYMLHALSMKYSLVCHATRTRVVVGGSGRVPGEMLSALSTDDAREAFNAFLMHNRPHALFLLAESWEGPMSHLDYYEFSSSAWPREDGHAR